MVGVWIVAGVMVMSHTLAKNFGQWSESLKDIVETNGPTDKTDFIAFFIEVKD